MIKTGLYSKCLTYDFKKLFQDKGYAWFDKGAYNLNTLEVKKGDFIQKGQLIGYSGDSGRSEGSRLYYELGFLDHNLNPFDYANWNLDNFEVVLKNDGSGIDWQNLIWAMEDIAKLQNFRISQVEITNDLVNR